PQYPPNPLNQGRTGGVKSGPNLKNLRPFRPPGGTPGYEAHPGGALTTIRNLRRVGGVQKTFKRSGPRTAVRGGRKDPVVRQPPDGAGAPATIGGPACPGPETRRGGRRPRDVAGLRRVPREDRPQAPAEVRPSPRGRMPGSDWRQIGGARTDRGPLRS